jgi:hypothetical protein
MKRVRYMIGAAGALAITPALGALTPAAHAATVHTAAGHSGKTVSLNHRTAESPACVAQSYKKGHSGRGVNKFAVSTGGEYAQLTPCIGYDSATLAHRQAGLKFRVRTYLRGHEKSWGLVNGTISGGGTAFGRTLNTPADRVCDALVYSASPKTVAYGPVCINL